MISKRLSRKGNSLLTPVFLTIAIAVVLLPYVTGYPAKLIDAGFVAAVTGLFGLGAAAVLHVSSTLSRFLRCHPKGSRMSKKINHSKGKAILMESGKHEYRETLHRFKDRRKDTLKQWKTSPIDNQATRRWDVYSLARNEMLAHTHNPVAPWTVVRADNKRQARLNPIKDLLARLHYCDKDESALLIAPEVVFQYEDAYVSV